MDTDKHGFLENGLLDEWIGQERRAGIFPNHPSIP
jgi:hypothetical protein